MADADEPAMNHIYPSIPDAPRPGMIDMPGGPLEVGMYSVALCADLTAEVCALCAIGTYLPRYLLSSAPRPIVIHGCYGRA